MRTRRGRDHGEERVSYFKKKKKIKKLTVLYGVSFTRGPVSFPNLLRGQSVIFQIRSEVSVISPNLKGYKFSFVKKKLNQINNSNFSRQ